MNSIKLYTIEEEVFQDFLLPSMLLSTMKCDGKCWKDLKLDSSICQNWHISDYNDYDFDEIINLYKKNNITESIIFGGKEPMLQFEEIYSLIKEIRKTIEDIIVIYTGYYKEEIIEKITKLKEFKNIIIKYGRYNPNLEPRYDSILGVTLASNNQFAERIS